MASLRYASYIEEEDWDLETLEVLNSHLEKYVRMLPRASAAELSLAELQDLAARQQAAMDTQQQALVAREARLKMLQQQEQRHRQLASETARLQRMRDKVEAQEMKLKKLRALRGQVEQYRVNNGNLNSELEAVRALFNEKEKELALAVSRVDTLMKQLQDLREVKAKGLVPTGGGGHKGDPVALSMELERLKQELMHRNKVNEQQNSHLAAQRHVLQQRKEEAARMDERIHELQQRLKKRRSQQQQQQQQQSQSGTKAGDRGSEQSSSGPGSRLPGQGWKKPGSNVAAVEPYIQHAPKDVVKDDLYSKTGFQKQDPKYQTLPPNTKFIPAADGSSSGSRIGGGGGKAGTQEVNNNEKSGGGGGGGGDGGGGGGVVKSVEHKIPALISSHFNAHRGQSAPPANKTGALNQTPSGAAGDAKAAGSSRLPTHTSTPSSSSANTVPQQHVSKLPKGPRPFVNTFGKSGLPKWPPEPKKEEEEETPPKTTPQQPPHHPQINIFDEERQAGSGQSSPASSEGSGPLVKQGSGVFVHPLAASSQNPPGASLAQTAGEPPHENMCLGQAGHSLDSSLAGPHEPQQPPPHVPRSVSSAASTDQPVVAKAGGGSVEGSDGSRPGGHDSVNVGVPQSISAPQGGDGKTGSTVHLNQRPAPTYRYASKNVIANTYMGRLGSSALERYQQLNKQLYSTMDAQGNQAQTPQAQGKAPQKTLAGELRTAFSSQQQDPSAFSDGLAGDGQSGLTQFGLVGSPSYPDIASDKGSFKANTPKHIRRRHSDSDNEDVTKAVHKGEKPRQQEGPPKPGDSSNTHSTTANVGAKASSTKVPRAHRQSGSEGGGSGKSKQEQQGGGDKGTGEGVGVVMRQKKTILMKGDNRRKSSNRVSFDPLALLLDASLEGELDLVTRTAKEVADVSTPNDEGITALHNAICAGHYDIVKFLIEFGADVNSPDSDGWTPLHCAASCNNLPMVRFLVEHGACIFATTISDNETAAEKCEEDEDGYDHCSDYLYSTQEKLGIANEGVVYAVFDYYASSNDELAFRINDKMTVLRKGDDVEKEWWWARLTPSKEGYIPRNLLGLYPRVLPSNYRHETSDC